MYFLSSHVCMVDHFYPFTSWKQFEFSLLSCYTAVTRKKNKHCLAQAGFTLQVLKPNPDVLTDV